MYFGKELEDWMDIYCLLKFRGENPISLKDLYTWRPPLAPNACLLLGFELVEARKAITDSPVPKWIADYMKQCSIPCGVNYE